MGQSRKISQALVICQREEARQIASTLIEESGFNVMEATSVAEGSQLLARHARVLSFVFAEAGTADEARMLTLLINNNWPWIRVLISVDQQAVALASLPVGACVLRQPWRPLDLLIEAERATK